MMATTPGDMQTTGRYMMIFLAKYFCLAPIVLATVLAGLLVWVVTQSIALVLTAVWLVLAAVGAGLVPLAVIAFQRFDVSRDTPA
jgi:hypothetical protein